jgi:hypothetical protein
MEAFYTEVKHYLNLKTYHSLTATAPNPESRKANIRRVSKTYLLKVKSQSVKRKCTFEPVYRKYSVLALFLCFFFQVLQEMVVHFADGTLPDRWV